MRSLNKYQTPLTEELRKSLPKEVWLELMEYIDSVEFIKRLIATEDIRGFAKDKERDDEGKIVVDITNPHILEDMDFFRERALFFNKYGKYTDIRPNRNKKSEFAAFWKEELRRWKHGLIRQSDGEWIPGTYYFYLNYSPIWLNEEVANTGGKKSKGRRIKDFPKPWLGDYLFFHYMEMARNNGHHCKLLKTRGVGFSYKTAAISPRNMFTEPGLPNFHLAIDKTFLEGDKGVYGKVVDVLDHIAENTPLPRLRLIDRGLEKQIGYTDEFGVKKGLKSSVFGISLKDNPDKARGVRGPLIHYEEDGLFPNLEKAWGVNRKAVEDGDVVYGMMFAGGCVCAGTKLATDTGDFVNIEDIQLNNVVVGYDTKKKEGSFNRVSYIQPPLKKECVSIKTKYRTLDCSKDHPILCRAKRSRRISGTERRYYWYEPKWKPAGELVIGDIILIADKVDVWGEDELFDPRLVGMLIGDGSYGMRKHYDRLEYKTPVFSNCDEELNNYILENYNAVVESGYETKDGRHYKEIRIRDLIPKLKECGIAGQSKLQKRLPGNYMHLTKADSALLLAGLFDTDGYIHCRTKNPSSVSITQSSREILEEIKQLLSKFGVHSIIRKQLPRIEEGRKDKNPYYTLTISRGKCLRNFYDNIPLLIDYKKEALCNIIEILDKRSWRKHAEVPNTIEEGICEIRDLGEQPIYNITAAGSNTYLANNIITHNTGGTEGADFEGSEKLFYHPGAYNIQGIPNIFDKNTTGASDCGFFWGAYLNRAKCYDLSTGEPDVIKSLIQVLDDRYLVKYSSSDPSAITQKKAEEPITPQEAIMRVDGTVFPVADLRDYLEQMAPKMDEISSSHYVGDLLADGIGGIKWMPNSDIHPVRDFPLKDNKVEGAVEIFEMPKKTGNTIDPMRYIAGIDSYDADQSSTTSLGSIFIFDTLTDRIVAEYTGRPKFADEFYEICRRLLIYYNAKANYENFNKGIFQYFDRKNCLYLLTDTPRHLRDMDYVKGIGYGNSSKGTTPSKQINSYARRMVRDWLLSPAYVQEYDDNGEQIGQKLNMHTIRTKALLEELIRWNIDGNFDRVSSLGMCMIYRAEIQKYLDNKQETQDFNGSELANDPYFNNNYRGGDFNNSYEELKM